MTNPPLTGAALLDEIERLTVAYEEACRYDDDGAAIDARDERRDLFDENADAIIALMRLGLSAAEEKPQSSIDLQQRRGAAWDIIDEALTRYDEFMQDDDYEPYRVMREIFGTMRGRRQGYATGAKENPQGREEITSALFRAHCIGIGYRLYDDLSKPPEPQGRELTVEDVERAAEVACSVMHGDDKHYGGWQTIQPYSQARYRDIGQRVLLDYFERYDLVPPPPLPEDIAGLVERLNESAAHMTREQNNLDEVGLLPDGTALVAIMLQSEAATALSTQAARIGELEGALTKIANGMGNDQPLHGIDAQALARTALAKKEESVLKKGEGG